MKSPSRLAIEYLIHIQNCLQELPEVLKASTRKILDLQRSQSPSGSVLDVQHANSKPESNKENFDSVNDREDVLYLIESSKSLLKEALDVHLMVIDLTPRPHTS